MSKTHISIKNYDEAVAFLAGGRDKNSRPVANNTRLERRSDSEIAVRLHATDVVTYTADGGIILDSGGWLTSTTKSRMAEFSPLGINQTAGVWYVSARNPDYVRPVSWDAPASAPYWLPPVGFADGMTWHPVKGFSGVVTAEQLAERDKRNREARAAIRRFCSGITAERVADAVKNSAGDCFLCRAGATDCVASHVDEDYVHATLLANAGARYFLSDNVAYLASNIRTIRRMVGTYCRRAMLEGVATR